MNAIQRILVRMLPRKWAEDMEADSRSWMQRCRCGHERSVWDTGGIRWKAAGNPRRLLHCRHCGETTWHATYKKARQQV